MSNEVKKPVVMDRRIFVSALAAGAAATGLAAKASATDAVEADGELRPTTETIAAGVPGAIWWNEYLSADADKTNFFYANVIGWKMRLVSLEEPSRLAKPGEKNYMVMLSNDEEAAGVMRMTDADFKATRPGWFTYIQVANVDESVSRVVALGGKVVRAPVDTNEGVRMAVIEDPEGCMVGLASPKIA